MKTQTKTAALLLLTFLLGSLCGAVLQKMWTRKEYKRFSRGVRDPKAFTHRFEEIIEPDEAQRTQIRHVLEKHHTEMMRIQNAFPARMDSLKKELDAILTEDQKEKLKNSRWFKDRPRHEGGPHREERFGRDQPPPPPKPEL